MPNYKRKIRRAARREGVRPRLLVSQLRAESGLNPNAVSPAGAKGIAQFMPATAASYGVNLNDGNPNDDIRGAARLMHDLLRQFGGDERKALAAYNAGPGAVQKYHGVPPYAETQAYVSKILKAAGKGGSGGGGGGMPVGPAYETSSRTVPGVDNGPLRQQLKLQYLAQSHDPNALLQLATGLKQAQDTPDRTVTTTRRVRSSGGQPNRTQGGFDPKQFQGVAHFDGKQVAGWIAPILQYAREQGWKGTVNSGFRSDKEQQRIYDSGVRPAAVPKAYGGGGSNHEGKVYPLGAIDVSEAQQLAKILRRSPFARYLKYAGGKDPVHFSHPHGGSY